MKRGGYIERRTPLKSTSKVGASAGARHLRTASSPSPESSPESAAHVAAAAPGLLPNLDRALGRNG